MPNFKIAQRNGYGETLHWVIALEHHDTEDND